MELEKICVFSGSSDSLNTSMTIRLDSGETVEVWISDEYTDSATPKAVKEAYLKTHPIVPPESPEMKTLREMAAKMGLSLVPTNQIATASAPAIVVPPPLPKVAQRTIQAPAPKPKAAIPGASAPLLDPNNKIISGRLADSKSATDAVRMIAEAGVEAGRGQYSITTQSKPSVDLKEGEVAEIGLVPGRGGVQVAIPVRRTGKTGTTNVRVVNTGGDTKLQQNFKNMAKASQTDTGICYGKNGYDAKTARCPLCGSNPNPKCLKCGGLGEIVIERNY